MTLLIKEEEFLLKKSKDLIPLKCELCGREFLRTKHEVSWARIRGSREGRELIRFCNQKCFYGSVKQRIDFKCEQCKSPLTRKPNEITQSKTNRFFCNRSCSAIYNNAHKTVGTRRSKLECWVESQLSSLYPNLEIHFNRKDTINGELDIYIPSLKLAFELNGIFHYEPIFSEKKLKDVKSNDQRKFQACLERGIELCIVDTSSQEYFKEKSSKKYLSIICDILTRKTGGSG